MKPRQLVLFKRAEDAPRDHAGVESSAQKTRQDTGKEHEENKFCQPEPKLYHKKSVVLEFNYLDIDKNLPACTLKCVFFLTVKHLQGCFSSSSVGSAFNNPEMTCRQRAEKPSQ